MHATLLRDAVLSAADFPTRMAAAEQCIGKMLDGRRRAAARGSMPWPGRQVWAHASFSANARGRWACHWTDPTTLEAFNRVADRLRTLRILLIVTFRPEFEPPWIGRPLGVVSAA